MKINMGAADRAIRFLLIAVIAILYLTNNISGAVAVTLGAFAVIFAFTSFTGFCPLYVPIKAKTNSKKVN
jgi:hypothetical protein